MYSPTMSRTFGANSGSLLNLNDSTRWGCSLCFFQIRCRCWTHLLARGHGTYAPMRGILRGRLHRCVYDGNFLLVRDPFGAATAWPFFEKPLQPITLIPLSPQQHRG